MLKSGHLKKGEEIVLKADRQLFANITLIAECRNVNMREIFSYPLGPFPWSLVNINGTIKKKMLKLLQLGNHLKKKYFMCNY